MKRYSPLIRKLVEATAEAEAQGRDVADLLRFRCFNDTSIIRQTLMNAVCDPRFKLYSNTVGFWKEEARFALEELAGQLSSQEGLTEVVASTMLETFLTAWFRMTFNKIVIPATKPQPYFEKAQQPQETKNIEDGIKMLEDIEISFCPPKGKSDCFVKTHPHNKNSKNTVNVKGDEQGEDNRQNEQDPESMEQEENRKSNSGKYFTPSTSQIVQIEEKYLDNIPPSLVELARRIGRMGEAGSFKTGKFLTASKSDISGITIGNEISSALPSELALLADTKTQNIFFSNYAARRLQVFASASQSKSPNKHQDGPVIICVDTSSSMQGEPVLIARALAVAVAIIAWRRNRDVFVVKYSDDYDYINLGSNRARLGELSLFLKIIASGGNNENIMFEWLFNQVVNNLDEYDSADILCITDFGWTELTEKNKGLIEDHKKKGLRLYGLNVQAAPGGNAEDYHFYPSMDVCDSVWVYANGKCEEMKEQKS